jgi:hypothetical protein
MVRQVRFVFGPLTLSVGYTLAALLMVALRLAGDVDGPWFWILTSIWFPFVVTVIAFADLVVTLGRADAPMRRCAVAPRR